MSNSSLVSVTKLSPNNSGKRTHKIDTITPHCVVGQLSAEAIGGCFTSPTKQASCNYGIGTDGRIVLVVDEDKRSWCSSSSSNDQRAVTIECASDKTAPYAFNDKVWASLVKLCVDICKRNGIKKLLWLETKEKTLAYAPASDEAVLTAHRWFKNKACPGDWMYAREGQLAAEVTAQLGGNTSSTTTSTTTTTTKATATSTTTASTSYVVQVTTSALNIRKGPGTSYASVGVIRDKGKYTIVETSGNWGLLKAYEKNRNGWISLSYTKKV